MEKLCILFIAGGLQNGASQHRQEHAQLSRIPTITFPMSLERSKRYFQTPHRPFRIPPLSFRTALFKAILALLGLRSLSELQRHNPLVPKLDALFPS